jgi:DNA modification methylase
MTQIAEQSEPLIALLHPNCEAQGLLRCSDLLDTVFCGDNTKILSGFPAECVDLVVTSPPYDNLRTYGEHSWNFEGLSSQLVRVLKPGGVIVWVVADATVDGSETLTSMRQAIHFKDVCGLNIHDTMIYQKSNGGINGSNLAYLACWEYCFVMSKGRPKTLNLLRDRKNVMPAGTKLERTRRTVDGEKKVENVTRQEYGLRWNIWKYECGAAVSDDAATFDHPAIFPDKLAKDHVLSWSNPGDLVLDPFAGSGTTLKAAKELSRRYVGIEINEPYINIIKNRLAQDALSLGV